MIPSQFRLLYTRHDIARRVNEIAVEISSWIGSREDVIVLPILRGAIFFFADLVRSIPHSLEIAPVRAWAYDEQVNRRANGEVALDIEHADIQGRRVLLIDDICDSGNTLDAMSRRLQVVGAIEVKSAVLIWRHTDACVFRPDWSGFEYSGPEWFVGYGMDAHGQWRNLPDVYLMEKE